MSGGPMDVRKYAKIFKKACSQKKIVTCFFMRIRCGTLLRDLSVLLI